MPGPQRDPLSVRYDMVARRALTAAVAARKAGQPARAFVSSPAAEFRDLDRGGLTAHERAFKRAAYWHAWKVPVKHGRTPTWSLKLWFGNIENRSGRWGRTVYLRVYRRGYGKRHTAARPGTSWARQPGLQSRPGARIDDRRAG